MASGSSLFFSLEGMDGSGKTTQCDLLANALRKAGHEVVRVREPGGTPVADRIRALLLDRANENLSPMSELLLYSAARAQLVDEVIGPALSQGKLVLSDRFGWSTLAYQGYGRGLDADRIQELFRLSCGTYWPRLTVLLDLPVASAKERLEAEGREPDRLESEKAAFFERVRQGYLEIARRNPGSFMVLNAAEDRYFLHQIILEKVKGLLSRK